MKVRYRKGAAIHSGPELWGTGREAVVEAFTGEWFPLSSKSSATALHIIGGSLVAFKLQDEHVRAPLISVIFRLCRVNFGHEPNRG